MTDSFAPTTFFREVDRNRRNSWLLVGVVIVVLGVLGGVIGYATGYGWAGVVIAVVVAVVMSIGSYFGGDGLVLASSGAVLTWPASSRVTRAEHAASASWTAGMASSDRRSPTSSRAVAWP